MTYFIRSRFVCLLTAALAIAGTALSQDDVKKSFDVSKGGNLKLDVKGEVVQITTEERTKVDVTVEGTSDWRRWGRISACTRAEGTCVWSRSAGRRRLSPAEAM